MAVFSSYTSPFSTGETKENIDSKLNLLAQMETPVYSAIGRGTTTTRSPQLIEDTIEAAANNSFVEGAAFSSAGATNIGPAGAIINPTGSIRRRSFNTQIFRKDIEVSASEEATSAAVRYEGKRRMAEQVALRGMAMKRDIEWAIVSSPTGKGGSVNGAGSAGDATNARYITDYWNQIIDSDAPYGDNTTIGSVGNVSTGTTFEDAINNAAEALYNTGGLSYNMGNSFVKNANMLVMSPAKKKILDTRLDAHTNARRDIGNMKVLNTSYSRYGSSFGEFAVVPDAQCDTTRVAMFNPQNWKWVTLRDTQKVDIAKVGDADRAFLVHEGTLIHRNRGASAAMTGLTEA